MYIIIDNYYDTDDTPQTSVLYCDTLEEAEKTMSENPTCRFFKAEELNFDHKEYRKRNL